MCASLPRFFLFGAAALMMSCLSSRPVEGTGAGRAEEQPLGSFTLESGTFGDSTLAPTVCAAGDRQSFLGADLQTPGSPVVLRLVVDPIEGPAVRLYSTEAPFDKSVVFRRSDCSVFHFSLDSTGWRINDYEDYRLTLQLDCAREGEHITGNASSTHCH